MGCKREECRSCGFLAPVDENKRCEGCQNIDAAGAAADAGINKHSQQVVVGKQKSPDNEAAPCGKCNKEVKEETKAVECDNCALWYHLQCTKVSARLYEEINEGNGESVWHCDTCKGVVKGMITEIEKLKEENEQLRIDMKCVIEHNKNLNQKLKEIEDKWEEKKNEMVEAIIGEVMYKIQQREDAEKRKNNLMIFKMKESEKTLGREREVEDTEKCHELFTQHLGAEEDYKITKVMRIGKRIEGRVRPVLVRFEEEKMKWAMITKAKRLRQAACEEVQAIGLALDMNKEEREKNKKLVEELKYRRQTGGRWAIRNGAVVRIGDYWEGSVRYQEQKRESSENERQGRDKDEYDKEQEQEAQVVESDRKSTNTGNKE